MRELWRILVLGVVLLTGASGHVVTQIFGEWREADTWEIEILFDAGYAVPAWRDDASSPAPSREWLAGMGEPGWTGLRHEAERYLRECLRVTSDGRVVPWRVEFMDFASDPPGFPEMLNDGAYFRMKVTGDRAFDPGTRISWSEGTRPAFVIKLPGGEGGYLTLAPGESAAAPAGRASPPGRAAWQEAFRQGFRHVVPTGLDHILFVMGLFFYRRAWRPLLMQSLAFTVAHTVTLGLASAGIVRVSSAWVDPLVAISLVVVALENLKAGKKSGGRVRQGIVFGFGLVHGLGFAGTLSAWIKPGEGFLVSLLCANLGVEAAQVMLLAGAWILTIPLHAAPFYPRLRLAGCLFIAAAGAVWAAQRIGWPE